MYSSMDFYPYFSQSRANRHRQTKTLGSERPHVSRTRMPGKHGENYRSDGSDGEYHLRDDLGGRRQLSSKEVETERCDEDKTHRHSHHVRVANVVRKAARVLFSESLGLEQTFAGGLGNEGACKSEEGNDGGPHAKTPVSESEEPDNRKDCGNGCAHDSKVDKQRVSRNPGDLVKHERNYAVAKSSMSTQ